MTIMMKKLLTIAITLIIGITTVSAQYYTHAIGVRVGYDFALTYKNNLSNKNFIDCAINITPFSDNVGVHVYASYNWNWEMDEAPGLFLYCGPGAGLGVHLKHFSFSINANLGLEYSFYAKFNVPIALSIDFSPGLGFYGSDDGAKTYAGGSYGGLGIKYTF